MNDFLQGSVVYGDINTPETHFSVKYDNIPHNQVEGKLISLLIKQTNFLQIQIASGNCWKWFTIDKSILNLDHKWFEPIDILNGSDSEIEMKKTDTSFKFHSSWTMIYIEDGYESSTHAMKKGAGNFVFIRQFSNTSAIQNDSNTTPAIQSVSNSTPQTQNVSSISITPQIQNGSNRTAQVQNVSKRRKRGE